MIRRAVLGVASTVLVLGGVGAWPASAADPPPLPPPPGVSGPTGGPSGTPGPTYVITPGVGGSELPQPGVRTSADKPKKTDRGTTAKPGVPKTDRTSGPTTDPDGSAVAGPRTPLGTVADTSDPVGLAWRSFAAAVLMLVLFEITVVRRYLLRPRGRTVTAG